MGILSKHVSHCLEELTINDLFNGIRDISTIKRKMSKSHFKAVQSLIDAGKEIDYFDKKIQNVFIIYRELVWTYNLRVKVKNPKFNKNDLKLLVD